MGATRKHVVIDPATGKLDRHIFSEQAIYDDEMEKIFGRAWLMIGHESRCPRPTISSTPTSARTRSS